MLEDLDGFLNKHQWIPLLIILLIMGSMVFGIMHFMQTAVKKSEIKEAYLMKECMKDRKEYECVALLKNKDNGFDIILMGP